MKRIALLAVATLVAVSFAWAPAQAEEKLEFPNVFDGKWTVVSQRVPIPSDSYFVLWEAISKPFEEGKELRRNGTVLWYRKDQNERREAPDLAVSISAKFRLVPGRKRYETYEVFYRFWIRSEGGVMVPTDGIATFRWENRVGVLPLLPDGSIWKEAFVKWISSVSSLRGEDARKAVPVHEWTGEGRFRLAWTIPGVRASQD